MTLTLVLVLLQLSFVSPSYNANAASSYVSSYVTASADIRPSPYEFTPITDTIQNQSITIIERDGLFFYIEYQKSNETTVRRGYIAYEDVNYDKKLISWCNHTEYNPGHISSSPNVYVYFGPDNRNTNYDAFINGYIDDIWDGGEIRLNSNTTITGYSDWNFKYIGGEGNDNHAAKLGVVCHEFGHALKLKHPYGKAVGDYDDQVVYSVMNQGIYTSQDGNDNRLKVKYSPTSYDKQTLLNKWKGEVE